jgi:hypothetical protein
MPCSIRRKALGSNSRPKTSVLGPATVLAVREHCAAGPGRNERESKKKTVHAVKRWRTGWEIGQLPVASITFTPPFWMPIPMDPYFSTMFSTMKKLAGETRAKAA